MDLTGSEIYKLADSSCSFHKFAVSIARHLRTT